LTNMNDRESFFDTILSLILLYQWSKMHMGKIMHGCRLPEKEYKKENKKHTKHNKEANDAQRVVRRNAVGQSVRSVKSPRRMMF
jgi:hypothetical protein